MASNQNETSQFRMPNAECSRDLTDRRRLPRCIASPLQATRNPKSAFTLTELLVVITIIAVLASLITVAVGNALRKAKQAAITLEIQQLSGSFEDFKNEYGAYPPNGMNPGTGINNLLGNEISPIVLSDFRRMFRKAFPRHQEDQALLDRLAGIGASPLPGGMTAAEAMVFWLGGFSSDPQFPLSGPGGPSFADRTTDADNLLLRDDEILEGRNRRYDFDLGRLGPRNADGVFHDADNGGEGRYIIYTIGGVDRRINFWQYAPNAFEQPLVYIDVSRHTPEAYDMPALGPMGTMPMVHALEKLREGVSAPINRSDLVFVNQGKFQILHAGIDDAWGTFRQMSLSMQVADGNDYLQVIRFPDGPFIGDIADTVGNFGIGTLADEQE
ncbi:MAG: prepilin-type N-terminal cleavage/methylation domain-containing protein [Planctomycetes bacterium]|nr:prepilin-type N-terminal cleavage/methylation domain-containing protein [Planctomycetota bacterium]